MHFERIYIQENFRRTPGDDPFLYGNIGVSIFLNPGDTMEEAEQTAKDYIKDYISRNTHYPDHLHIETRTIPDIQVEQAKSTIDSYVEEIEKITDLKELKSWEALTKSYPEIKTAYEKKWIVLKADSLLPNNKNKTK